MSSVDVADLAPYLAEFIGSFFVVLSIACTTMTASAEWAPTGIGCTIMVCMYMTAAVSGGHLNPALSFALGWTGKCSWHKIFGYWVAQFSAGVIASYLAVLILQKPVTVHPVQGFNWWDVMFVEAIYTAMYCFVGLHCLASRRNNPEGDGNQFFGLAIGFVGITAGHAAGGISGGFINPAAVIGFGVAGLRDQSTNFQWSLLYALFQVAGAFAAVVVYIIVRPEELHSEATTGEREALHEPQQEARSPYLAKFVSEFVGTYLLVLSVLLSLSTALPPNQNASDAAETRSSTLAPDAEDGNAQAANASWAAGAAVLSLVYALGGVSGGHFNPANTLAVMLSGRDKHFLTVGVSYMLAQAGAGVCAALTFMLLHTDAPTLQESRLVVEPKERHTWTAALVLEAIFTAAVSLIFMCMMTVSSPRYRKASTWRSFESALAIGMVVTAGSFALGGISGGQMNPAATVGMASVGILKRRLQLRLLDIRNFVAFLCAEGCGSFIAAVVFAATHPFEYKKDPLLVG